ncbi:MAG: hypothetical protein GX977_00465 [Firmicutes bacterium]|nr:hypothetical protein [Bacillota bacterium]
MVLSLGDRLRQHQEAMDRQAPAYEVRTVSGPQLASGFLGGTVKENGCASYYLIEEELSLDFPPLAGDARRLERQLQLITGIGPKTAQRLEQAGVVWVAELLDHSRFGEGAAQVLQAIEARDAGRLSHWGASDWDLARLFDPEDFVFLDLETTGLCFTQPLFLIGLIYFREGRLCLRQLLARSFEEEIGVLREAVEILGQRPVWVSYNGRTFDEPFLNGRLCYHLGESLAPELHIDLLRHVRRYYRDLLPDCRLTTVETYILDAYRSGDVPGYMIPQLYYQFVWYQEPSLLEAVLLHNARDLQTLVQLLGMLQGL